MKYLPLIWSGVMRKPTRTILTLLSVTVAFTLFGLMIGSVVHGVGDEVGDSGLARDIVTRLGGTAAMEQAFIAMHLEDFLDLLREWWAARSR